MSGFGAGLGAFLSAYTQQAQQSGARQAEMRRLAMEEQSFQQSQKQLQDQAAVAAQMFAPGGGGAGGAPAPGQPAAPAAPAPGGPPQLPYSQPPVPQPQMQPGQPSQPMGPPQLPPGTPPAAPPMGRGPVAGGGQPPQPQGPPAGAGGPPVGQNQPYPMSAEGMQAQVDRIQQNIVSSINTRYPNATPTQKLMLYKNSLENIKGIQPMISDQLRANAEAATREHQAAMEAHADRREDLADRREAMAERRFEAGQSGQNKSWQLLDDKDPTSGKVIGQYWSRGPGENMDLAGKPYTPAGLTGKVGGSGSGGGGFGGSMKARYDQNMIRSGNEVIRTIGMLHDVKATTSGGIFGGGKGEGMSSWMKGKLTDEDQTDFNSAFAGADQEMGNLLRNGLGVSDRTAEEMTQGFKPVASDTNFNRVFKLANMAAKAKTAIQSTFPADPAAKASQEAAIAELDKYPTPEEVRKARQSDMPIGGETFGDILSSIKTAGSGKPPAQGGGASDGWKIEEVK